MATFTEHLRARDEHGLVALLRSRPDLASPPPAPVRSLAAGAANRASLDRAVGAVDALVLAVLEAVLALEGTAAPAGTAAPECTAAAGAVARPGPTAPGPTPLDLSLAGVTLGDLARAMGQDEAALRRPIRSALDLALLWTDTQGGSDLWATDLALAGLGLHPAPGLHDVLGPYPAGLGPRLASTLARRTTPTLTRLAGDLGIDVDPTDADADALVGALAARLSTDTTVTALLDGAPSGVRPVLDALTWGPPVGRAPSASPTGPPGPARAAVDWLLRHGLLAVGDPQHVILPREVALVLRGGRTHRDLTPAPAVEGRPVAGRTVAAEAARDAEEAVRLVATVLQHWGDEQPPVLRSGGLGSRELRRLGARLDAPDATAALVVEIAGAAGLVADDGEEPAVLVPTSDADEWLRLALPERWAALADAWLRSERAAWLVGTRDDRGGLRAALDPELRRPWAPRLRASVLQVLADSGTDQEPAALDAGAVHEALRWRTPRSAPPQHAVEAVLTEAAALGVLGAGALSGAGRALLASLETSVGLGAVAEALASALPEAVEEVLLQGDLTGIVPGRPSTELSALLERSAHVESRGAAVTVRFTEGSVRAALDAGLTAEGLLAQLSRHARSGVPQPLEYLVLDTARRHGQVRVGMASSYLRADDPTLLAGLVEDRSLRGLGLLRIAPTVIAAQVPVAAVLAALRDRGLAPVAEDPSANVLLLTPAPRRVGGGRGVRRPGTATPRRTTSPAAGPAVDAESRRLRRLAADLLRADQRESATLRDTSVDGGPGRPDATGSGAASAARSVRWGTPDPVLALELLREAAAEGREVWLEMIGADGAPVRRRVRPLRVDGGRVRAVDAEREAELTVAVHRIAGVSPV